MRLAGKYIVESGHRIALDTRFQRLSSPVEHDPSAKVIFVRGLNPSYVLLFDRVELIVTRFGSRLSHLAILAREHGVPIFQTDHDIRSLPAEGMLRVDGDEIELVETAG